jgi:carbon-monoxide dehydrogenase medium subunit
VRNRGTLGGSLAHADPAADWVVAMAALGARIELAGPQGLRHVGADALMQGAYTTVVQEDELIQAVHVPVAGGRARWGYYKFCRKTGEFAEASCAAWFDPASGQARIALGALDGPPRLLPSLAARLAQAMGKGLQS